MLALFGYPVYNIDSLGQYSEQLWQLLGRVLEIIIHGHDDFVLSPANTAKQSVVLTEVAHETDARDPVLAL